MTIPVPPAYPPELTPRLIFEDTHLIVLSKPPGLLSQGEHTGDRNLVDWLRAYLGRPYVGLVHRLDRNTSGVMIVGKRTKAAQRLTDSLQEGTLTRAYRAWLVGRLSPGTQKWSHLLQKDESRNIVRVVSSQPHAHSQSQSQAKGSGSKPAVLSVTALASGEFQGRELTLAEFILETGRSHQIRAQAAAERVPILGDSKYGASANAALRFARPALHSFRIEFDHPMSKERMSFEDPLPEDMRTIPQRPLA